MSIDVDDLYKPLNPATKSLKPRVRVRALQESQGHLLRGDQDSGHLRRKRSAAIALLLSRSAGEHCDSVSLAGAKAPTGQLEKNGGERKREQGGGHTAIVCSLPGKKALNRAEKERELGRGHTAIGCPLCGAAEEHPRAIAAIVMAQT